MAMPVVSITSFAKIRLFLYSSCQPLFINAFKATIELVKNILYTYKIAIKNKSSGVSNKEQGRPSWGIVMSILVHLYILANLIRKL